MSEHRLAERNSPVRIIAVLATVLGLVVAFGLVARGPGRTVLAGTATAVSGVTAEHATGSGRGKATEPSTASKLPPIPQRSQDLAGNPLLRAQRLPHTSCKLPPLGRTEARLTAYYQALITCLNNAWRPVLAKVNEPFEPPKLNVQPNPRNACGFAPSEREATAFYCSADETIYVPKDRLAANAGINQAAHLDVLAHEYGHHVQHMSGILGQASVKENGGDDAEAHEISRRVELQANCFGGMFLASIAGAGSVSHNLADAAVADFANTRNDVAHGTVAHQVHWGRAGYTAQSTAECNTWTAPAKLVS